MDYIQASKLFAIKGDVLSVQPYGEGYINKTYLVVTTQKRYILQQMNTSVFPNSDGLMANICAVTEFLRGRGVETLEVIPTLEGKCYHKGEQCYRMYAFIENTISYQTVTDNQVFANSGFAFGQFQNYLAQFDASVLCEVIPNFHHTPKRFQAFVNAVQEDSYNRAKLCQEEIAFVLSQKDNLSKVVEGLADGSIPLRVTHNDTKLNNILMDANTNQARAIIDLDTIMPGSMLYDFGDSIRSGASTSVEDEQDLSKVHFDISKFQAYAQGFCSAVKESITQRERELLPYSAYLLTMECGIRFLTDYLQGNIYFSTKYQTHNLVRCRTQFKLAQEIFQSFEKMHQIVSEIFDAK